MGIFTDYRIFLGICTTGATKNSEVNSRLFCNHPKTNFWGFMVFLGTLDSLKKSVTSVSLW